MNDIIRYGIEELAHLGGISRRAVRFYIQERLISPPGGFGRGKHYGPDHLSQIVRVRNLQEQGKTLEEIRRLATDESAEGSTLPTESIRRENCVHLVIAEGIQLQIGSGYRLPAPKKLAELADWCLKNFRKEGED